MTKKTVTMYCLGLLVVVLCVGAAVAHLVGTHGASPLGAPASR